MSTFPKHTAIRSPFWTRWRETVRTEGIPYQWKALNDQLPDAEPSYCMRNFRIAAGKEQGEHAGCVFQDSDVAKWLEGVAFSLREHPDQELEAVADSAIEQVVAAQLPDGYLNTYYIINGVEKRWTNLMDHHELYCAGHMIEAAVAYYEATGKRTLLDAMIRYVAHIAQTFGAEEGKLHGYPGHPVIEMALARLYEVTGDPTHLQLAKYFVDQRGQAPLYFEEERKRNGNDFYWKDSPFRYQYYQAGKPVREQAEAEGHAVRAVYLYSGMADVARLTGDESLRKACETLWQSITRKRMYITGAIGSSEFGESFTFDYDLPNDTMYGETCAAIGLVFFAKRMLQLSPKAEYADVMERALYNGVISGMQLDGKRFFYVNPLEVLPEACEKDRRKFHVKPERQKWFGCACCPPNIIRMLESVEDYVYSVQGDTLYTHLYMGSDTTVTVGGQAVTLHADTDYPWNGEVRFTVDSEAAFRLALRVPSWCSKYAITVNEKPAPYSMEDGYAVLDRKWQAGDSVALSLDMPVAINRADPRIPEDAGKVAITRGPLVYCLEEADNGAALHMIRLSDPRPTDFTAQFEPNTLCGVVTLTSPALRETAEGWNTALYRACDPPQTTPITLRWIPYYAWANRGKGEMRVWVREGR